MINKVRSILENMKEDFKYPFFLIALVIFLFLPSMLGKLNRGFVDDILFIIFIISSLFLVSSQSRRVLIFTYFIGIIGISAEIVHFFIQPLNNIFQVVFMVLLFTYFITLFSELIRQIFKSKEITINVVFGAFTGYIMIGIIGHFVFKIIFLINPSSFLIAEDSSRDLIYFTFITLTTIGYGDISPLTDPARNFAVIMGLVGQFYNSVIIAIIIGKFLQK